MRPIFTFLICYLILVQNVKMGFGKMGTVCAVAKAHVFDTVMAQWGKKKISNPGIKTETKHFSFLLPSDKFEHTY